MSGEPDPSAWFLGPKGEHRDVWQSYFDDIFSDYTHWRRNYRPRDELVIGRARQRDSEAWFDELSNRLDELLSDLKIDFPFFHPRYLAHMTSEQSLPAVLGYFAGMLYNPNNVTLEAAPITVHQEREVGRLVAEMLGYDPQAAWAHITSGGTIANLEALWAARAVQFAPFGLRAIAVEAPEKWRELVAALPPGGEVAGLAEGLCDRSDADLLGLPPVHTLELLGCAERECHFGPQRLAGALGESGYDVRAAGYPAVLAHLGKKCGRPLHAAVFASDAAHYSVEKVCDVLGYGADAVKRVPLDPGGRIRPDLLAAMIDKEVAGGAYVAAVIGTVGTTERGAVDPIDHIVELREERLGDGRGGFWLHVDAAWGGYVATLFRGVEPDGDGRSGAPPSLEDVRVKLSFTNAITGVDDVVDWPAEGTHAAFLKLPEADSITVDPHKLGYVPYPAGVVAFRRGEVRSALAQRARYIFEPGPDVGAVDQRRAPIGPYVLEGSKPGAAAAACWLAHKTIPLDRANHGRIVSSTVLSARRLHSYLSSHEQFYLAQRGGGGDGDEDGAGDAGDADAECPFTLIPLGVPDTNILCYVVRPMRLADDGARLERAPCDLETINGLNAEVHRRLAEPPPPPDAADEGLPGTPHGHPFFLSRTRFEQPEHSFDSVKPILGEIGLEEADKSAYVRHGLTVLRSTVMNPHYLTAEAESDRDYLYDFVCTLHRVARASL